jgi:hypothetical protein
MGSAIIEEWLLVVPTKGTLTHGLAVVLVHA